MTAREFRNRLISILDRDDVLPDAHVIEDEVGLLPAIKITNNEVSLGETFVLVIHRLDA